MPNVYNNKKRRAYHNAPLALLTTAALVFLAGTPTSAQSQAESARLYNPNTPWEVTDNATALNPSCLLQRRYNPDITVKISSDITGRALINVSNIPETKANITGIAFDKTPITNFSANGATQLNATLPRADTDLAPLYGGEYITLSYDDASDLKLPIQSTTIAEARMSLCVDVIDSLKSINTEAAVSIDLDEIRAAAQAYEARPPQSIVPQGDEVIASTAIENILPPSNSIDAPIDAALSQLIDEVSSPQKEPAISDTPDVTKQPPAAASKELDPMMDIDSLIDESLTADDTYKQEEIETAALDEMPEPQQAQSSEAKTADAAQQVEASTKTPPIASTKDSPPLNIESDVTSALETSLNQATNDAIEDFAVDTESTIAEELASGGEIMNDDDILTALTQNANDTADTKANILPEIDTASEVSLDALITMDDTATNADTMQIDENIASDIDDAIMATLSGETVSAEAIDSAATALPQNMPSDALFDETLSIEIDDDSRVTDSDNQDIVEDLSNEDFSDEELLALLDDPEALSDNFAEIMIEEEFKQIKPMEGVRQMLGLGTPDEIAYKKVPWLLEEDIDSQWKEKVKLLEREKEMLRLRLADTNANPIADLISRKRNRRTQEELVEKIKALEAENNKLKKGLLLSDNPEEFLGEDLKISNPKSGMRMGMAQSSKVDLINEEIDKDLDSLETRMDSFLKGVGEDYALANTDQTSPLASASLTQDVINILKAGYVVDPDALKIRAYRHKSTGTAVTAWEAGDLQGRAERTVLPPNADFTAYVERFLNAAQLRCTGNFTAVPDTSTRNLKTLDIHCNDGAIGQRSSVIFIKHGSIITAIATTTNLPKGGSDFLRDIRKRIIEGIRVMDRKKT
tara:strand:+ start:372932 stop:375535 length:2604 start_codon:yes stop_codon:yes gene_type:complete